MGQCKCAYREGCDYIWGDYRGGRLYSKTLTSDTYRPPKDIQKMSYLPTSFRPWVAQFDTRIIPGYTLTAKQKARHIRFSIFDSKYKPELKHPRIALNMSNSKDPAISRVSSDLRINNSTFRILHRHLHTPHYHQHTWKKHIPRHSSYYKDPSPTSQLDASSNLPPELITLFDFQLYTAQRSTSHINHNWFIPTGVTSNPSTVTIDA